MYIATAQGLTESLPRWQRASPLALDTEFIRVDTFFPRLGLIQLGDGQGEALLDPLAVTDLSPLAALLGPSGPLKILHACSEDLEVLTPLASQGLGELHDTQIALALLGEGLQVGYQRALQLVLGIDIPKDASRSDWLQRPLTPQQRDYAALDVRHLPALYAALCERLHVRGLMDWYLAECGEACRLPAPIIPDQAWLGHGHAWKLAPQGLAVLRAVMAWREREAVARNVPRGHLIKPVSAFELARRQPRNLLQLADIPELNPRIARRDGVAILALIAEAAALPVEACPPPQPTPLPREAGALYDALKHDLQPLAGSLGLPLEVLWRKRLADRLIHDAVDHGIEAALAGLDGWRAPLLQPRVAEVLRAHHDVLSAWAAMRRQTIHA